MYFQIVSTFLRNLQGFLWETPKLFLCGFGQNYLVFSYQISKRLNSWLFWRKGNTFHIENSPFFLVLLFFFFFPHFWQAEEYKNTWKYSSYVMKFQSENKIYSLWVFLPAAAPVSANTLGSQFDINTKTDYCFFPCNIANTIMANCHGHQSIRNRGCSCLYYSKQSVLLLKGISCPSHTPLLWLLQCSC